MYLIVIAWMYVVLMMSVAEATNTTGSLLGAIITFVMYGLLPISLVIYLLGAPMRGKAIKRREAEQFRQQQIAAAKSQEAATGSSTNPVDSVEPDAGRHATGGAETISTSSDAASVAPVRKEM